MKSYRQPKLRTTSVKLNASTQGETLEQKIERIVNNKEPIKDGAPLIYTERREGIRPSTNIRTDRFEVALEATGAIAKSYTARREENAKKKQKENGEPESIPGKDKLPQS